jgi:hypothetical protein
LRNTLTKNLLYYRIPVGDSVKPLLVKTFDFLKYP